MKPLPLRIRYMGNKHALAPDVARLVTSVPSKGPLIDLFCGMCSIGSAVAASGRPVWGNDIQAYAALAAHCHLSAAEEPLRSTEMMNLLSGPFEQNAAALSERFDEAL